MKCPECDAYNPDGNRYCGNCGIAFLPGADGHVEVVPSRNVRRLGIMIAAVIVVAAIAAIVVLDPFTPKRSGYLELTVETRMVPVGESENFTVYIDGRLSAAMNLVGASEGNDSIEKAAVTIHVDWKGNVMYRCTVEVFFREVRYAGSAFLVDGMTIRETIWMG